MKLVKGNMWKIYGKTGLFCITTNGVIQTLFGSTKYLVMGAGIAGVMNKKVPSLSKYAGEHIYRNFKPYYIDKPMRSQNIYRYGVCYFHYKQAKSPFFEQPIGLFQTKYDYADKSSLELIEYSTQVLINNYCPRFESIVLNFPGIGLGKLDRSAVLEIIEQLPDNVTIYEK